MSCRALDYKNSFSLLMSFTLKDCVTDPHQVGRAGAPSRPPPPSPCSLDRSGQPYAVAAEAAAAEMMVAPPITHISLCCCCCCSRLLLLLLLRRTRKLETLTIEWQLSHHVWYMTTTITSNRPQDGPTNNFVFLYFFCSLGSPRKRR
jgi:hypothetical protein